MTNHPNYYEAFVLDPDGHNIEVVCHEAGLEIQTSPPPPNTDYCINKQKNFFTWE